MNIKSVIFDDIYFINFLSFNISTLFFSLFTQLNLGCVLYTRAPYMPSNTAV